MGLTVLRAKTLTLKDQKEPLLSRGQLGLVLRREKQQKYPFPWGFLSKIEGKRPRFQVSLRIFVVLVLVFAFLGFVLVFFVFFWFVAMDSLSILGSYVVLNISMSS